MLFTVIIRYVKAAVYLDDAMNLDTQFCKCGQVPNKAERRA